MERLINRRQQGDLGEASAIEWLTRQGATVSTPLGHSPDYDLIADFGGRLVRVQVKTSVCAESRAAGGTRWSVAIRTNGGNQSWSGTTKRFDTTKVDGLFVLVGDGRRWFIPSADVEGTSTIRLGGPKYAEFEIEGAAAITPLVYGNAAILESAPDPGEYRSGQTGCAVNALAQSFVGSNPASPITEDSSSPRRGGRPFSRYATIWGKRRVTIPRHVFQASGLKLGDRLKATATGPGEVLFRRVARELTPSAGD